MTIAERLSRRLRYGKPIVIVSGLPRSGTSMLMNMLLDGGVPLLTDGIRNADHGNSRGYFEYEPVKALEKHGDLSWLPRARGKAVKIISFLLTWLPERYDYRVIFMQRDLDEIIASQNRMLARPEEPGNTAAIPALARCTRTIWSRWRGFSRSGVVSAPSRFPTATPSRIRSTRPGV